MLRWRKRAACKLGVDRGGAREELYNATIEPSYSVPFILPYVPQRYNPQRYNYTQVDEGKKKAQFFSRSK